MTRWRIFFIFFVLTLPFFGQACTFSLGGGGDGGVYKTSNKGSTWEQISWISRAGGGRRSFANTDITTIAIDPRDARTLVAGTRGYGLLASENAGESWARIYTANDDVVSIVLDPRSKCVLYFATPRQVLKSSDCAKTWNVMFDETRVNVSLTSLVQDKKDPGVFYLTNSAGEVLKSTTFGITWSVAYIFPPTSIRGLTIDTSDHLTLYATTSSLGVFRSVDGGETWEDVSSGLAEIYGALTGRLIGSLSRGGGVWYVSDGGVFLTESRGTVWKEIALLTSPQNVRIVAFAVNPSNDSEFYYATTSTLYHSQDGGVTWIARPLPSSRSASVIVFDPFNTSTLYLGTGSFRSSGGGLLNL